jgi:hypothetical protein
MGLVQAWASMDPEIPKGQVLMWACLPASVYYTDATSTFSGLFPC